MIYSRLIRGRVALCLLRDVDGIRCPSRKHKQRLALSTQDRAFFSKQKPQQYMLAVSVIYMLPRRAGKATPSMAG
jgi:hypothetical protein